MARKKYFVAYVTQDDLNACLFHNSIIDVEPTVWVLAKNSTSQVKYTLLNWVLIEDEILTKRSLLSYVTQTGLGEYSFKTEVVTGQDALTWLAAKNAGSPVKYVLINWTGVPRRIIR